MKIHNRDVFTIFNKALDSVNPRNILKRTIWRHNDHLVVSLSNGTEKRIDLKEKENIYVVGCGKATALMAQTVENVINSHLTSGIISVKYGYLPDEVLRKIECIEAGHPEPDQNGITAATRALEVLHKAQENDLIIALISGGGSALWPLPVDGISLKEKIITTRAMLECGASIEEINCIRQCLSMIKGGKAAIAAYPAQTIVFMISDVENDDPSVIASGPFTGGKRCENETLKIIKKYNLSHRLPERIFQYLLKPPEYLRPQNQKAVFSKVTNCICSNNAMAIEAASQEAKKTGYSVTNLGTTNFGEARTTAINFVDKLKNIFQKNPRNRQCIIAGGETTVTLGQTYGKGGRNQEFALAAAIELDKVFNNLPCKVTLLSCGTDGTDGPTDATGAVVDNNTVYQANAAGLNPQDALNNHDAYPFFEKLDTLVKTGPTNTNVMDIQIAILDT